LAKELVSESNQAVVLLSNVFLPRHDDVLLLGIDLWIYLLEIEQ